MVVGKHASQSVRGSERMAESKSATTGPPAEAAAVAPAKEDAEGRAGGSPHPHEDGGNAAPASQFRIMSVAQVEGEEAPLDPMDASVNEGLRASICLSDSNSLDTEQTDGPDPLSPAPNQRPPSPVEEVLHGPALQNHHSLRLNGSNQLTSQQSQQQGSSRFRKVAKYLRERWQVEDSVETDRGEEGKSSSTVTLSQTTVLVGPIQSGLQVEGNSLASSSSPNLYTTGSERWEHSAVVEPQEVAHEKAGELRPPSKLSTHEVKVLVQLSPQQSLDPAAAAEGGQLEPLSTHSSDRSQSGASSPTSGLHEEAGRDSSVADVVGEGEEIGQHEGSGSSSAGTR